MKMKSLSLVTIAAAMLAAGPSAVAAAPRAPVSNAIASQYIVVLDRKAMAGTVQRDGLRNTVQNLLTRVGGAEVMAEYSHALLGFAARMSRTQAEALAKQPGVAFIEQDQVMSTTQTPTTTQTGATWGLDRVDERTLPMDGLYVYPAQAGAGTHVYIIDTGLSPTHTDFTGRVGVGRNFASNSRLPLGALGRVDPVNTLDCNGHGTHVSGTAVGTTYGVAKRATVHPVRVLGCNGSGTNAGVIAGVDWVAANAIAPAVANMSLGGGASAALDLAVENAVDAGVVFAVSAGNSDQDACLQSPARTPSALTVGATTNTDARSSFSNFGECVDIFGPGSSITSASHTNDTGTRVLSGTSMSSPHVAGAAALVRGSNPAANVDAVIDALLGEATLGVLSDVGPESPNAMLYVVH
ncbi:S8 family peptidase [Nevskia sp.]|uniref:S8 family peptidase n=1 Tax=Nevskia sp. TaxID=1929292 RepID=UPI0025FB14E0|nr:S8 family peptidase [Nevskia sp.]